MRYSIYLLLLCLLRYRGVVPFSSSNLDPHCLYPVCVTVRIENYRSEPLHNPSRHIQHGILMDVIKPVAPHSQETFFLRKREWSNYGVNGVFVYELNHRKIIIFLSVPLPETKHSNSIGISITKEGSIEKSKSSFTYFATGKDVEKHFESWSLKRITGTSDTLVVQAGGFTVEATMNSRPITEVVIKVI